MAPLHPPGDLANLGRRAFNSGGTLSKYGQISGVAQSQGARNLSARAIFRDIEFAAPQNADCALWCRHKAHSLTQTCPEQPASLGIQTRRRFIFWGNQRKIELLREY